MKHHDTMTTASLDVMVNNICMVQKPGSTYFVTPKNFKSIWSAGNLNVKEKRCFSQRVFIVVLHNPYFSFSCHHLQSQSEKRKRFSYSPGWLIPRSLCNCHRNLNSRTSCCCLINNGTAHSFLLKKDKICSLSHGLVSLPRMLVLLLLPPSVQPSECKLRHSFPRFLQYGANRKVNYVPKHEGRGNLIHLIYSSDLGVIVLSTTS